MCQSIYLQVIGKQYSSGRLSIKRECGIDFVFIGKGPQTFSTVFTRITGDFGLVAQYPLFENGLLFMILSSSAVPVFRLGLKPVQDDFQHDFARMTNEADGSVFLTER